MKIDKFKNVSMVSNLDGLISIFCDHEKRGSEYYHEYFFLDNDTHEIKAHFASTGCLSVEQLLKENETLFEFNETLFNEDDETDKHFIIRVNPDFSYEVLHEIEDIENGIEDGAFAICKNGLWGFMDENGSEFIKPQYKEYVSFSFGFAGVCKDGKWGFINKKNKLVIPYLYEFPERTWRQWKEYNDKLYISVIKDCKWGIIDSNNNVVIPFMYDYLGDAGELIYAQIDNKTGFIDINNNIVVPFIYEPVEADFCDIYCDLSQYELIGKNGLLGLFDKKNLKEVIPCEYKKLKVDENGIVAQKLNDKFVVLNFENKELSAEFECIRKQFEDMFSVFNGEASAFMNRNGEILTPFIYMKYPHFSQDGLCIAQYKDYKKGTDVINKKGEVLYHSDKYRDVFNAGNGYILAENQDGEFEFKKLI